MKKTVKRSLAFLLAALMALALSTAASAVPPKSMQQAESAAAAAPGDAPDWTLSITKQPDSNSFVMYTRPVLTGMEISVNGGIFTAPITIKYNDVGDDVVQAKNKLLWDFWVEYPDDGWKVGNNATFLRVWGYQCTEFHYVTTDGGTQYGYFDQELVFEGRAAINVVVTPFDFNSAATPLGIAPANATVTLTDDYEANFFVFKFTAPQDGFYSFKSDGARRGGTYYSVTGQVLKQVTVDPWAELYDKDGYFLAWDDDRGGNYNFAIYQQLKAGDIVYLVVGGWVDPEADNTDITIAITRVGATQPVLALASKDITVNFHDLIDLEALLEGSGYEARDLWIDFDWDYIDYWWYDGGMFVLKRGETTIFFEAPDGSAAQVKVTIQYSAMQWLCVILLGGWAWMPFTGYGPFNLWGEIKNLFSYGIFRSLFDLFFHWRYGLFSRLMP